MSAEAPTAAAAAAARTWDREARCRAQRRAGRTGGRACRRVALPAMSTVWSSAPTRSRFAARPSRRWWSSRARIHGTGHFNRPSSNYPARATLRLLGAGDGARGGQGASRAHVAVRAKQGPGSDVRFPAQCG